MSKNRQSTGLVVLLMSTAPSFGLVNLELRPVPAGVGLGETVDVGIYAVSVDGTDAGFSAVAIVLLWDSTTLAFQEILANGPHAWSFVFGFSGDSELDWLNAPLTTPAFTTNSIDNDGDALFEAASFGAGNATPAGLLVATLRFVATSGTPAAFIEMGETFGLFSVTQVLAPGATVLTGTLSGATVRIADVHQFADLQVCYTGDVGPVNPPAYSTDLAFPCDVFDFDSDGDIDAVDYQIFVGAMLGLGD